MTDTPAPGAPSAPVAAVSEVDASLAKAHPEVFGHTTGIRIEHETAKKAAEGYEAAIKTLAEDPSVSGHLTKLKDAHTALAGMEETVDGVTKMKAGVVEAEYKAAQDALKNARTAVDTALKAEGASEAVKKFGEAQRSVKGFSGMFGEVKTKGTFAAIKSNFTPSAKNNGWGKVAMRGASSAAGGVMLLDAFRAKTAEGEDRSWAARIAEGAAGAGLFAGGLVLSKAR